MKLKPLDEIEVTFNIFDRGGRSLTGVDRGYLLDNVTNVINSNFARERVRVRDAVGYIGHNIRNIVGMDPPEKSVVTVNGAAVSVEAIPSNVTLLNEIDKKGNVRHIQRVLDNEEGKKLIGMNNSKLGGFSWACDPAGKVGGRQLISKFYGWDYVRNPNYLGNRGYVLDSAADSLSDEDILNELIKAGVGPADAKNVVTDFYQSASDDVQFYVGQIESLMHLTTEQDTALAAAEAKAQKLADAASELEHVKHELARANQRIRALDADLAQNKDVRNNLLSGILKASPAGIPEKLQGQVIDGDPDAVRAVLDSAFEAARSPLHSIKKPTSWQQSGQDDKGQAMGDPKLFR